MGTPADDEPTEVLGPVPPAPERTEVMPAVDAWTPVPPPQPRHAAPQQFPPPAPGTGPTFSAPGPDAPRYGWVPGDAPAGQHGSPAPTGSAPADYRAPDAWAQGGWGGPQQPPPQQPGPWGVPQQPGLQQPGPWGVPQQPGPQQPGPWGVPQQPGPQQPGPWGVPQQQAPWGVPQQQAPWGVPQQQTPWGAPPPQQGWAPQQDPRLGAGGWAPTRPSAADRTWAPAAHWLPLFTHWVGPLAVLLTAGRRSQRVRAEAVASLNWEITVAILLAVATALAPFGPVAPVLAFVTVVLSVGFHVYAALTVARGGRFTYPGALPFIS